jgi:hypothetical protein
MTMRKFLKDNKETIAESCRANGLPVPTNNDEREQFVMNDEGWYKYAQQSGVKV